MSPNTPLKYTLVSLAILLSILAIYKWFIPAEPLSDLRFRVSPLYLINAFETRYFYLGINLFVISLPFLLSFDKKVHFYRKWYALFPAIILTAMLFIPWDVVFTANAIWGFNPQYYLSEYAIFGLPLEEWLFFLTVPYACVFIYECLHYYVPQQWFQRMEQYITAGLLCTFILLAVFYWNHAYTAVTSLFCIAFLLLMLVYQSAWFRGRFYMAFVLSIIPFLLVNGALTGMFTQAPVVVYNDAHNLAIRIISIPLDDALYAFLLLGINISLFEAFLRRYRADV